MKKWIGLFFLSGALLAGEQESAKRVYAHLMIQDPSSAVAEAADALKEYPESKSLQLAYIRALAERGDETAVMEQWKKTAHRFKEEASDRRCLETLAWGVLNKGEKSEQFFIRFCSLLGAALTRDVRALPLLLSELRGTNSALRSMAIKLSTMYGDGPLQQELARLLKEEKVWNVRLDVIGAVGQLRMVWLREDLKEIVGSPRTLAEEKSAAIVALVNMYDAIGPDELSQLVGSSRAGLRQLACQVIAHLDMKESVPQLEKLSHDSSPEVRRQAIYSLGLLGEKIPFKKLEPFLHDSSPAVAITAAWVGMLCGYEEGGEILQLWMRDPHADLRRLAASALAAAGKAGVPLALKEMETTPDPYVRANLAIGLIGQRTEVKLACGTLYSVFFSEKETHWMWDDRYPFRSLSPSFLSHTSQIPNYPHMVDQLVRLDVLTILSVMRYPKAQEAVKGFLKNTSWGVTGAAAATLLEEGDEEAMNLVRSLLKEEDSKVRIQAALILAMMGNDNSGLGVLLDAYGSADREMKVHILEAVGRIGDISTVPFLLKVLQEPFQLLRVVAASALIQTLYH